MSLDRNSLPLWQSPVAAITQCTGNKWCTSLLHLCSWIVSARGQLWGHQSRVYRMICGLCITGRSPLHFRKRGSIWNETCIIPESRCWGPGAAGPPRALSGVSMCVCLRMCICAWAALFCQTTLLKRSPAFPLVLLTSVHTNTPLLFSYITDVGMSRHVWRARSPICGHLCRLNRENVFDWH